MSAPALHELSITQAGEQLRAGSLTSAALAQDCLLRIAAIDPKINAFITLTADRAMNDAREADASFARGVDRGPLQGIPYGLKDIYDTAGIRTTCHSKLRVDNVPTHDSAVEEKFRAVTGALVDELGYTW